MKINLSTTAFPGCRHLLYLATFILMGTSVSAQDRISLITWTDFNYTYNKSSKLGIGGDIGARGLVTKSNWALLYVRPTVKYHFTPFVQAAGSVGLFQNFQTIPGDLFELRLAQEAKAEWPSLRYVNFSHRLRFEERFLFHQKNTVPEDAEKQQNYRFRYMLNAKTNYFKFANRPRYYYLVFHAEYFIPLAESADERFFNASRLSGGFGQELKLNWNYEIDLIWQRSVNTLAGNYFTDEYIIRLRVFFEQYKKDKELAPQ